MKRYCTGFAFALTACFFITGCGATAGNTAAKNQLNTAFTTGVTMELDDFTAEGTVQRIGAGEWNISFTEPAQLAGVRLDFSEGEVTASYKGLVFSVPQKAIPVKSVMQNFITVTDQLAESADLQGKSEDDGIQLTGELEAGSYLLLLHSDGSLSEFKMDNINTIMTFHDFSASAIVTTEESESIVTTMTETETIQESEETETSSVE